MMDVTAGNQSRVYLYKSYKYNEASDHYFIGDDQRDIEAESSFTKTLNYQTMRLLLINY